MGNFFPHVGNVFPHVGYCFPYMGNAFPRMENIPSCVRGALSGIEMLFGKI